MIAVGNATPKNGLIYSVASELDKVADLYITHRHSPKSYVRNKLHLLFTAINMTSTEIGHTFVTMHVGICN